MDSVTDKEAAQMRDVLKQFFDDDFVNNLNITPVTYAIANELFDATESCTTAVSKLPLPSSYFNPQMFLSAYARDLLIRKFQSRKGRRFMGVCMTMQKSKWRSALVIASNDAN